MSEPYFIAILTQHMHVCFNLYNAQEACVVIKWAHVQYALFVLYTQPFAAVYNVSSFIILFLHG